MKGVKVESPSEDFRIKVMSRILAEAAVMRKPLLQDYKPVITNRTWIVLSGIFVALVSFIIFQAINATPSAADQGVLSTFTDSMSKVNTSLVHKGFGLFSSIPTVAYLIILASLSLWTLDSFLSKLKHHPSNIE